MTRKTLAEHLQALWDEWEMWLAEPPEDYPERIKEMIEAQMPIRRKQAAAIVAEVEAAAKLLRKFRRRVREVAAE